MHIEQAKQLTVADLREYASMLQPEMRTFIDSELRDTQSGKRFETLNPANGEIIASVPAGDAMMCRCRHIAGYCVHAIKTCDMAFELRGPMAELSHGDSDIALDARDPSVDLIEAFGDSGLVPLVAALGSGGTQRRTDTRPVRR